MLLSSLNVTCSKRRSFIMNRNHQGRNDHNRTNQGRHKLAYRQTGRSNQSPSYQTYSQRYGNARLKGEDFQSYDESPANDNWLSHFNRPESRGDRPRRMKNDPRWEDVENDEMKSYDYDRFHRGVPPVEVKAREKYRHDNIQNHERNSHGHDLSYRARAERHPERFSGEEEWLRGEQTDDKRINYAGMGPKSYRRSDARIEEEVCEILLKDRYVDASDVAVNVEDGVVRLAGTVANREDRFAIERVIDGIWGVEDIENDIKVKKRQQFMRETFQ